MSMAPSSVKPSWRSEVKLSEPRIPGPKGPAGSSALHELCGKGATADPPLAVLQEKGTSQPALPCHSTGRCKPGAGKQSCVPGAACLGLRAEAGPAVEGRRLCCPSQMCGPMALGPTAQLCQGPHWTDPEPIASCSPLPAQPASPSVPLSPHVPTAEARCCRCLCTEVSGPWWLFQGTCPSPCPVDSSLPP